MDIDLNNTSYCYILFYIEDDRCSTVDLYGNKIAGQGYACLIDDLDDLELECLRTSVEEKKRKDAYLHGCGDSSVFLPNIHIGRTEKLPCDLLLLTHFLKSVIFLYSLQITEREEVGFQECRHGRFGKVLLPE